MAEKETPKQASEFNGEEATLPTPEERFSQRLGTFIETAMTHDGYGSREIDLHSYIAVPIHDPDGEMRARERERIAMENNVVRERLDVVQQPQYQSSGREEKQFYFTTNQPNVFVVETYRVTDVFGKSNKYRLVGKRLVAFPLRDIPQVVKSLQVADQEEYASTQAKD